MVAGLVHKDDPRHSQLPADRLDDPRLGFYQAPGRWQLPQTAAPIYFLGSWRRITPAMLIAAIRRNISGLSVRCGPLWLKLPLALAARAGRLIRQAVAAMRPTDSEAFDRLLRNAKPVSAEPGAPIVFVCPNLSPGGAERQVMYTVLGLHRSGAPVQLLCDLLLPDHSARYDFFLPPLLEAGVPVRAIRMPVADEVGAAQGLPPELAAATSLPMGLRVDIANLYLEFRALKPAVVHAWLDWSNIRAGLAAALAGVPKIVISGRNLNPRHFAFYRSYMEPAYKALCGLPNVVFLNNSEAGATDYAAWLAMPPSRIRVIRNALDFGAAGRAGPDARAAFRARYGISRGALLIGGAFRLYPEKNPLLWVEAAAKVARQCATANFIIFGQGVLHGEVEALIGKLGLTDRFSLPGVTDDPLTAISAMDVFLLTSYSEGLPNAVIEAQWVGTPVVATEAGGTREAVDPGRTGWIVDRPSPDAVATAVLHLLDNPELREACETLGPDFVRRQFDMDRMISETVNVYGLEAFRVSRASPLSIEQA
ncbi:MAG TPA: glycosyltransferase [Aliidongia sp.]|nr:glycosyltransferase [Aliidongia sp.]